MNDKYEIKNDLNPLGGNNNTTSIFKTRRFLVLYLLYIGIIVAFGAKLGAFSNNSFQPSISQTKMRADSSFVPVTPESRHPLPLGILAFNKEIQKVIVQQGQAKVQFFFNFTNISSKKVIITEVTTSCGCTSVKLPPMPWILPPHTKGQIPVTMSLRGYVGIHRKSITVTTLQGFKKLTVEANILPPLENGNFPLRPGILAFNKEIQKVIVQKGQSKVQFLFNFTNISYKKVIITGVTTSCECTTVKLPPMPWILPPHTKGQIPVTMRLLGDTGTQSKTITVTTLHGSKELMVEAAILTPVENTRMVGR